MDLLIEEFSVNNDPPSDRIVQEVKKLLVKPLQDLKDIDLEILTLERRVQELKSRRNDTEKWIVRYQSILSPMRNLPCDVLGEIFQHCLSSRTNPIMKGTASPLLLTRVCRLWRSVALSEPRLWSKIHITFTELDHLPYPSQFRDQQVLQRRLDAVKEWISRSGRRPLSLSIYFNNWSLSAGPRYSPTTMELLRFLSQLSPRFEDLEVDIPFDLLRQLEKMLNVAQMINLTSFRVLALPQVMVAGLSHKVEPLSLLKAPNLRRVSIFRCNSSFWGISDPSYTSVWSKLTSISCDRAFSKDEIISLLARTPNLEHFSAIAAERRGDSLRDISHQGPVSLPFLHTLFLWDDMTSQSRGDLYERIDAPELKWVMFTANWHVPGDLMFIPNWHVPRNRAGASQPIPINTLLNRATSLEKLTINPPSMDAWDMESMFRTVHSITHLFIGDELNTDCGTVRRMQQSAAQVHTKSRSFDFDSLVPGDYPLLPNLLSFEIASPFTAIDGESLLRFIKSRMAPPAGSGMSALKHVASGFYRTQGPNLVEDVRRHAELLGVKTMDLVLGYEEPQTEKTKAPEPESGLMKPEVPTGLQANVDNYIRFRSLDSE